MSIRDFFDHLQGMVLFKTSLHSTIGKVSTDSLDSQKNQRHLSHSDRRLTHLNRRFRLSYLGRGLLTPNWLFYRRRYLTLCASIMDRVVFVAMDGC